MKRFAFIDVQNTASTTRILLGFFVDWQKLYVYLHDVWKCERVFFYSGIDDGDTVTAEEFELLAKSGAEVKTKTVHSYKKPNKTVTIKCVACGKDNAEVVDMGYNHKSNCDVDLSVDAMEESGSDREFLVFTGDGDFEYLVRRVVEKGTRVYIVSSNAGLRKPGVNTKRLSTKLKKLIDGNRGTVNFIEIDSWKKKIKRDI